MVTVEVADVVGVVVAEVDVGDKLGDSVGDLVGAAVGGLWYVLLPPSRCHAHTCNSQIRVPGLPDDVPGPDLRFPGDSSDASVGVD